MPIPVPIAIVGATGYTGLELVRLSLIHPGITLKAITSQQSAGKKFADLFPGYAALGSLTLQKLDVKALASEIKVAFLCLPHEEAMEVGRQFLDAGVSVIDLSADFRIKNPQVYEAWYAPHTQQELLKEAVYGLPEIHRALIPGKRLIANPGCYPTSVILGLTPLIKENLIDLRSIIADSKSGTSGAGRGAKVDHLFCEVNENFKPYKIGNHRHLAEIEQELSLLAGTEITISFTPHLVPIDRGILSTIYANPHKKITTAELIALYKKHYDNEPFITVLPEQTYPSVKQVRGTNQCQISPFFDERTSRIVVCSAIDNLTKGASGQAIQCFNILANFPETTGLDSLFPLP